MCSSYLDCNARCICGAYWHCNCTEKGIYVCPCHKRIGEVITLGEVR